MSETITILTESGVGIGFGHLMRMGVLADTLKNRSIQCACFVDHRGDNRLELLGGWQITHWLDQPDRLAVPENAVIIVDSYLAPKSLYESFARTGARVVAVDDYERLDYEADLILNPNPYAIGYKSANLGGCDFVLLRDSIKQGAGRFALRDTIERVTITIGGSDDHDLLPSVTDIIASRCEKVTVITGNDFRAAELTGKVASNVEVKAALSGPQMCEVFVTSDLVISACGQTLHELAFLGIPTIGICVGSDQKANQEFYVNAEFLGGAIDGSRDGWQQHFLRELEVTATLPARAKRLERTKELIDGQGADRLAGHIASLIPDDSLTGA